MNVPNVKMDELLLRLNRLKLIPRTGWLFCNIPPAMVEDVAQHSFEAATITMFLSDELKRSGKKVNRERAVIMALLHDFAEAEVADFPYTALKYLESNGDKRRMERGALENLLKSVRDKAKYLALWNEYSDKRTLESKLVHAADYLSLMIQALKYREAGNRSRDLDELWRAVHGDIRVYEEELPLVKTLVKKLDEHYSAL